MRIAQYTEPSFDFLSKIMILFQTFVMPTQLADGWLGLISPGCDCAVITVRWIG